MVIDLKKKFSSRCIASGFGCMPPKKKKYLWVLYGGIWFHSAAMTVTATIQFSWDFLEKSGKIYGHPFGKISVSSSRIARSLWECPHENFDFGCCMVACDAILRLWLLTHQSSFYKIFKTKYCEFVVINLEKVFLKDRRKMFTLP